MVNPQLASLLIWVGLAGLVAAFILKVTERTLAAKTALIIAVLAFATGGLFTGLNPGIDLKGGTSLLYQVDLKDDPQPEQTMEQIIKVLQDRVDPNGVRNLVWRTEGQNRIEVQMPLAGSKVREAQAAYTAALGELEAAQVTRDQVLAALALAPEQRTAEFEKVSRGSDSRKHLLEKAAAAFDERAAALAEYEKVKDDADKSIDAAGRAAAADLAFDKAVDAVMADSIDRARLLSTLELSTKRKSDDRGEAIPGTSPRDQALSKLYTTMPGRKADIEKIVAAYDAYQQVKGPLDDANDLMRLMRGTGVLEFRITVEAEDAPDADALVRDLKERGPRSLKSNAPRHWFRVHDPEQFVDNAAQLRQLLDTPRAYLASVGLIGDEYGGDIYVLLWNTPERSITRAQPGWKLTGVSRTADNLGFPAVGFQLNETGANLMGELTRINLKRRMAILLDGRVYSNPPTIQSRITDSGQISGGRGGFSQDELDYMIRTLGAGSLGAQISSEPISVRNIGPALGADNLNAGLESAVIALIAVAIFMMVYYFFGGLVADAALMANIVIILGVMAMLKATFTLPGIAGIVLTIGMCVDANVLIFERIREELYRGRDMLVALRLGYEKAFSSIIDGNVTNLIVCVILGYTATADIKGFAVVLGIGICSTLFTALFMTRVIFEWYYRLFGARKLKMMPSSVPAVERLLSPRIDWIGLRRVFLLISGVAVATSILFVVLRGGDIFDIEFRGGTEVEFNLKDGGRMSRAEAEDKLKGKLRDATVIVMGEGDPTAGYNGFSVLTTETESKGVSEVVRDAFAGYLDIQPVIRFAGAQFDTPAKDRALPGDRVLPITSADLGKVISRPGRVTQDVAAAVGGVAIVLDDLDPPANPQQIEDRLRAMRLQPDFEQVQLRDPPRVIGIESAGDGLYKSVVVISTDPAINYLEDELTWRTDLATSEWNLVNDALGRTNSLNKVTNFTPTVARTMTYNAIVAMLLSVVAIIAYIWFRFGSLGYGLAAIAALVHDVIIALGLIAVSAYLYDHVPWLATMFKLEGFKINMAIIAAILTLIGYSLNDTIIVFDRIRENRGKLAVASPGVINDSINQTISRSVITSGTTFLAVFILFWDGGPGVHGFAFAMVVGILVGTYSSVAIAAPLLLVGTKYAGYKAQSLYVPESAPSPHAMDAAPASPDQKKPGGPAVTER